MIYGYSGAWESGAHTIPVRRVVAVAVGVAVVVHIRKVIGVGHRGITQPPVGGL
jgi:hypothetical protein